jgi:hypothetical protein
MADPKKPAAEPKKRPDARPMRLAYAAGAMAAVSASTAGLVHFGGGGTTSPSAVPPAAAEQVLAQVPVRHVIHYVHLRPGQAAPAGAKVITEKAPAPRIVVTHVASHNPPPTRVIVTHQSGHP